jgi:two-component system OmpR family response regulator
MTYALETPPRQQVLIVEDDTGLRQEVSDYLSECGYLTHAVADATEMEKVMMSTPVDLIILDVMLPGEDGLSICRRLSERPGPAIIIISARGEQIDRVLGLELGADDYLPKPCAPRELLARVRAVLRRQVQAALSDRRPQSGYRFAGFVFDNTRAQLRAPNGATILLTAGEVALLNVFLEHPRRVLTRDELLDMARGDSVDVFDRAVDVQVSRLRRKLGACCTDELIKTVRGAGYILDVGVSSL